VDQRKDQVSTPLGLDVTGGFGVGAFLPLLTKGIVVSKLAIVKLLFVNPDLSENYFEEIFAINREFGASV
jgi:hypothetical protein